MNNINGYDNIFDAFNEFTLSLAKEGNIDPITIEVGKRVFDAICFKLSEFTSYIDVTERGVVRHVRESIVYQSPGCLLTIKLRK